MKNCNFSKDAIQYMIDGYEEIRDHYIEMYERKMEQNDVILMNNEHFKHKGETMSYQIHVVEDSTYSVLLDGIQLFMDKEEQYYSNRSDFERVIVSCSVVYVAGEYQATIIYKDVWNDV